MSIFLSVVFVFFLIGYPIFMIVDLIRKHKQGKKIGKRLGIEALIGVGVVIALFVSIVNTYNPKDDASSDDTSSVKVAKQKPAKKQSAKPKVVKKKSVKAKQKPKKIAKKPAKPVKKAKLVKPNKKKKANFTRAEKEEAALALIKEDYKGKARVWFDAKNKAFMIQPTGKDIKEAILAVRMSDDKKEWHILTDSFDAISRSVYKSLGLADYVSLVNPEYKNRVLYTSLDGMGIYDFMEDK